MGARDEEAQELAFETVTRTAGERLGRPGGVGGTGSLRHGGMLPFRGTGSWQTGTRGLRAAVHGTRARQRGNEHDPPLLVATDSYPAGAERVDPEGQEVSRPGFRPPRFRLHRGSNALCQSLRPSAQPGCEADGTDEATGAPLRLSSSSSTAATAAARACQSAAPSARRSGWSSM